MKQLSLRAGSMWVLAAKVAGACAAYVLAAVLSHQAGAAAYGAFELALTVAWIAAMVGRLGLDGAWVRHGAEAIAAGGFSAAGRSAMRRSLMLVLAVSGGLGLALSLAAEAVGGWFGSAELADALSWAWLAVPGLAVLGVAAEMLRGADRMQVYAWLQRGTLLLATLLLFGLPSGLSPFEAFSVVAAGTAAIALVAAWRAYGGSNGPVMVPLKQLLRTAWPMLAAAATFELMSWADTLLCGLYLEEAEVGKYRLAFRLAALLTLGQTAINAALAPRLARAHAAGDSVTPMLAQASRWNWAIALSGTAFLLLTGGHLLPWFGSAYGDEAARATLQILLAGAAFNAVSGPVLTLMNMTGAERPARNIVLAAAAVNIALNVLWIPRHGIEGAAWATTLSTVLWNAAAMLWVWRRRRVWTWFPTKMSGSR